MARIIDNPESPAGSFIVLMSHLLPLVDGTTEEIKEEPQAPIWVDNWQRLGLVEVTYMEHQTGDDAYDWVQTRPEYVRLGAQPGVNKINFTKGIVRTTAFGRRFLSAVSG
jgi:hypothetical protein